MSIVDRVKGLTRCTPQRLHAMANACRAIDARKIRGDIVECGVWQGANIIIARSVSPERVCWLYDTFNGMTKPTEVDQTRGGTSALVKYDNKRIKGEKWSSCSLEQVITNLGEFNVVDRDKLKFVPGDVCTTLPVYKPEAIALLRLDTDWYESTKCELYHLFPRLSSGGVLLIDDYHHWQGAKKAVDEYFGPELFAKMQFQRVDYSAIIGVKP